MQRYLLSGLLAGLMIVGSVQAADWGDLKVKFTYDGGAYTPSAIDVNKDPQFCGKHGLKNESLVVDPATKGIKNVVVSVYVRRGKKISVHPDYAKTAKDPVELNNKNCRYEPHVVALRTGQKLTIGNPDPIAHNSKIDFFKNSPANPIIPPGQKVEVSVKDEETLPARVSCSIHPWMEAWVIAKDHPYVGISNAKGEVEIKNLPEGELTFLFWHEKAGYLQSVTVNGKKTSWKRGRGEYKIGSKPVELDVKVPAAAFK